MKIDLIFPQTEELENEKDQLWWKILLKRIEHDSWERDFIFRPQNLSRALAQISCHC